MSGFFTTEFTSLDINLSLISLCFGAFTDSFEPRIKTLARICRYSLFSKHPRQIIPRISEIYTSECFNLSLSDREIHTNCKDSWRISVLVSLWRFFKDFIWNELSAFCVKFRKIKQHFVLFKFIFKLPNF